MSYPGVPANLTAKVDKCVKDVLADKDFKAKGDQTRKQSAIAVCVVRIAPKKKDVPVKAGVKFVIHKSSDPMVSEAVRARAFYTVPRPVRSVKSVDGRYRAYGVLFGDDTKRDLYKQYFTRETDFHLDWYKSLPWLYGHGLNTAIGAKKVGTWDVFGVDDIGVFIEGELDKAHAYHDAVVTLIDEDVLFPSSRAVADLVKCMADGRIVEWPIVEVSTTVAPAEYRMTPVSDAAARAIKTLGGNTMADEHVDAPDAEDADGTNDAPAESDVGTGNAATDDSQGAVPDDSGDEDGDGRAVDVVEAYSLEEVADAVAKSFDMGKVIDAITLLDETMKSMAGRIDAVEAFAVEMGKKETEKVQSMLKTGGWFDKLYVASKDAPPVAEDDGEDGATKDAGARPLAEDESIWERLTEPSDT